MNSHLLPFPYNQSQPPTWRERVVQPFSNILFGTRKRSMPEELSTISFLQNNGDGLPSIRIICISDTHNKTYPLPPGDILVHAGDLTVHGTFDEMQAQLQWLSSQSYSHKIVIAGNHDILLDAACDTKFLTRQEDSAAKRKELDWGGIQYLQGEAITLELPVFQSLGKQHVRKVKIYGSPLTPEMGFWAFQYPPIRDVWTGRIPDDIDVLVVHGPPALYGDCEGEKGQTGVGKVKGDGYLLREIRMVRPKMVICGYIHGAFGLAVIQYDRVQDAIDGLHMRWEGYGLARARQQTLRSKVTNRRNADSREGTLVVNAAVVPGALESEDKNAIAIDFH